MASHIRTYRQDRPAEYLTENPNERWRCDIFPPDGSDHHGVGATEAMAIINAALAYLRWQNGPLTFPRGS
jgi:hypothetical protein